MASSLSNLVNNFFEDILKLKFILIHKLKCKYGHDDEICGIKYKYCNCFLEIWKILLMQITRTQKEFVKILK